MKSIIGRTVSGKIDRPIGSRHPRYPDMIYTVNYGYVEGFIAGDGEQQDAYVFGTSSPLQSFRGKVIAVYHRFNDVENKWIVSLDGSDYSDEEILQGIHFQEKYFEGKLIRQLPDCLVKELDEETHPNNVDNKTDAI
jgi:inorganic pyrophosphatase